MNGKKKRRHNVFGTEIYEKRKDMSENQYVNYSMNY